MTNKDKIDPPRECPKDFRTTGYIDRLLRHAKGLRAAGTQYDLRVEMQAVKTLLGFDSYLVTTHYINGIGQLRRLVLTDSPTEFSEWHQKVATSGFDPLGTYALRNVRAVFSDDVNPTPELREYLDAARRRGYNFSLTIQQHGVGGTVTLLTLLGRQIPTSMDRAFVGDAAAWLVAHFHEAALDIVGVRSRPGHLVLTDSERECLELLARGHRIRDIGMEMGVAARTVTYYIDRSMKKLGAWKPAEAIALALMRGEISVAGLSARSWNSSKEVVLCRKQSSTRELAVGEALNGLKAARSLPELAQAASRLGKTLSVNNVAVVAQISRPGKLADQFVLTNYSGSSLLRGDGVLVQDNPAFGGGPFSASPVFWSDVNGELGVGVTAMTRSCKVVTALCLSGAEPGPCADHFAYVASAAVRRIHERLIVLTDAASEPDDLSAIEQKCLGCLAAGQGLKNVASLLDCSTRMARYRVSQIAKRLGAKSPRAAVSLAVEYGLLRTHLSEHHRKLSERHYRSASG